MSDAACECCPCEFVPIYRCEHLQATAAGTLNATALPLLECDARPRLKNVIVTKQWSPWVGGWNRAAGGQTTAQLQASQLNISAILVALDPEILAASMLNNAAQGRLTSSDGAFSVFLDAQQRRAENISSNNVTLSLFSARVPGEPLKRFVTAGVNAANRPGAPHVPSTVLQGSNLVASPVFSGKQIVGLPGDPDYEVDIYRDGTLIAKAGSKQDQAAFIAATAQEGSYLFVCRYIADARNPAAAAGYQQTAKPGAFVEFYSAVIDNTPPVNAMEQLNDYFVGDASDVYPVFAGPFELNLDRPFAAPGFAVGRGLIGWSSEGINSLDNSLAPGGPGTPGRRRNLLAASYAAGTHTIIANPLRDPAFNEPAAIGSTTFTVHPVPENDAYGANAKLVLPDNVSETVGGGVQSQGIGLTQGRLAESQSLAYADPVRTVRLVFNKRVEVPPNAKDACTLLGDGVGSSISAEVESLDLVEKSDGREYLITLPEEPQEPNTQWTLTFTPTSGFIALPDDGSDGVPEPCILAARAQWVISQPALPGRVAVGTFPFAAELEPVPTLSEQVAVPLEGADNISFSTGQNAFVGPPGDLPFETGLTFAQNNGSTFVPGLPKNADASSDGKVYSWFNIATSLHPSPPAMMPVCAAPSEEQRFSSLIFGSEEIKSIQIRLKPHPLLITAVTSQFQIGAPPKMSPAFSSVVGMAINRASLFPLTDNFDADAHLLLASPFVVSNVRSGLQITQNRWRAESLGGSCPIYQRNWYENFIQEIGSAQIILATADAYVTRQCNQYPGLKTATVGNLRFRLSVAGTFKYEYRAVNPLTGQQFSPTVGELPIGYVFADFWLTKSQEESLANGGTVTCYDNNNWTFGGFLPNGDIAAWQRGWELKAV